MIDDIILKFLFHDNTWRTLPEIAYHSGRVSETGLFSQRGQKLYEQGLLVRQMELRTDEHKRPVKVGVFRLSAHGHAVFEQTEKKTKSRLKMLDLTGMYGD